MTMIYSMPIMLMHNVDVFTHISFPLPYSILHIQVGEKNKKALTVTYCRDTPQKDPTNTSVSVNSGTNRSSADKSKRKARRVERRLSS